MQQYIWIALLLAWSYQTSSWQAKLFQHSMFEISHKCHSLTNISVALLIELCMTQSLGCKINTYQWNIRTKQKTRVKLHLPLFWMFYFVELILVLVRRVHRSENFSTVFWNIHCTCTNLANLRRTKLFHYVSNKYTVYSNSVM